MKTCFLSIHGFSLRRSCESVITNDNVPEFKNGFEFFYYIFCYFGSYKGKTVSKGNMSQGQSKLNQY